MSAAATTALLCTAIVFIPHQLRVVRPSRTDQKYFCMGVEPDLYLQSK